MATWYYYDGNGQKHGPIRGRQLKWLAKRGIITPETVLEDEKGKNSLAEKAHNLTFTKTAPSPPSSAETDTAVPPPPSAEPAPQSDTTPVAKGNHVFHAFRWIFLAVIALVLIGVFAGRGFFTSNPLIPVVEQRIQRDFIRDFPLEIISKETVVEWTDESAGEASYSVKMKATEAFYESVGNEYGRQKLEMAESELYQEEFDTARKKYLSLPVPFRNHLGDAMPKELSSVRFYEICVPKEGETTLTGSVALTNNGKGWDIARLLVKSFEFEGKALDENKFVPESKLPDDTDVHKLDGLKTEQAVGMIIQSRKDFADKVESTVAEIEKLTEATKTAILSEGLPLEILETSVDWTDKSEDAVSGNFAVKAKAAEDLYQSVSGSVALKKLGMAELDDEEDQLRFYEIHVPNGDRITLTGNVKLTQDGNKDWQASVRRDSHLFQKTEVPDDAYDLGELKTKGVVEARQTRKNFEKFCRPDKKYTGSFQFQGSNKVVPFDVRVVFDKSTDQSTNKITGTITIFSPGGEIQRSFTVDADADGVVTGIIDNDDLIGQNEFMKNAKVATEAGRREAGLFYDLLRDNVVIHIQFSGNKMLFFITTRDGSNRTSLGLSEDIP